MMKRCNPKYSLLIMSGVVFFCIVGMLGVFTFLNFFASLMLVLDYSRRPKLRLLTLVPVLGLL